MSFPENFQGVVFISEQSEIIIQRIEMINYKVPHKHSSPVDNLLNLIFEFQPTSEAVLWTNP